ncbi:MAG: Lrp/AsnC family transcriptional regulator [Candidatus Endobugula sp.]|jgi:Lrp/AsnC family transcriptional regulator
MEGSGTTNTLNKTDLAILKSLQTDANFSTSDMAEQDNLPRTRCWERIQRLEGDGYSTQRIALLNRKR